MIAKADGGGRIPEKSIVLLSGTVDAIVLWLSRLSKLTDSACRKRGSVAAYPAEPWRVRMWRKFLIIEAITAFRDADKHDCDRLDRRQDAREAPEADR